MTNMWLIILTAVAMVESSNGTDRYNYQEQAFGIYQIRQSTVTDLNNKTGMTLNLIDFLHDDTLSRWAFFKKGEIYGARTPEEYVRIWHRTSAPWDDNSNQYWMKVETKAREIMR